ncbi:hypothetical protein V5O48_004691 [Marasmius crinis-equi]|uniref:Uncharacterized protein n=1 Tax=Marasmius crinis-equi TaxID=585013 RepID=A0ABR3FPD9_9AGAR
MNSLYHSKQVSDALVDYEKTRISDGADKAFEALKVEVILRGLEAPSTASNASAVDRKALTSKLATLLKQSSLAISSRKSRLTGTRDKKTFGDIESPCTFSSARVRIGTPSTLPPTVEEIAKGLHLSRSSPLPERSANQSHGVPCDAQPKSKPSLYSPPGRSAMKRTTASEYFLTRTSSSGTDNSLSTSHSHTSLFSFKSRVFRIIVGSTSSGSSNSSRSSIMESDPELPSIRKSVRFVVDREHSSNAFDDE